MDIEEYFGSRRIVPWRMQEIREQLKTDEENLKALLSKNLPFEEKDAWEKLEEALTWVKSDIKTIRKMAKGNAIQIFSFEETSLLIMKAEELLRKRINSLVNNGCD